jgi:tyrosyl-tRNA synthetase
MPDPRIDLIDELRWRGLLHQCTDEGALREHLRTGTRSVYCGFDPTSDSLTIGNLVPIMLLVHVARAGHTPVVLMGGGTGLIGDPSGKSQERQLQTPERVAANIESQRGIFGRVFAGAGQAEPRIVNNLEWLGKLGFLEVLRDVGKHFSVNVMIQKDAVKSRLESRDQGISYTEFSYQILQAYDFAHLFRAHGVTVQMGASDQWGNIVAGTDFIRRTREGAGGAGETAGDDRAPAPAFGLTAPLLLDSQGNKIGKSVGGTAYLSAHKTSPYALYQFLLNTQDADVGKMLRFFTLLPREEIEAIEAGHGADPGKREAQRRLAREVTALVHGPAEMEQAESAGKALFSGEVAALPEPVLLEVLREVPSSEHPRAALEGEGASLIDLLVTAQLAASKREAKDFLAAGSVTVNGRKVGPDDRLRPGDLLHGRYAAIRRGKKAWHLTRWGGAK